MPFKIKKYGNKFCTLGDLKFHSLLERKMYSLIKRFIDNRLEYNIQLSLQKTIILIDKPKKIKYIADFYLEMDGREPLIIDAKGIQTPIFTMKKRIAESIGINIHVVYKENELVKKLYNWIGVVNEKYFI